MERKVFRSRISVAIVIIITVPILIPLIPMIREGNIFNPAFYTMIGVIAFVVLLFCGIRYELTDSHFKVKMWGEVPLSEIVSVERSYNILSSPAASLKRLKIRFQKGYKFFSFILISPVCEQEFLETLKKLNPDIYIRVPDKKGWWRIWDWDI